MTASVLLHSRLVILLHLLDKAFVQHDRCSRKENGIAEQGQQRTQRESNAIAEEQSEHILCNNDWIEMCSERNRRGHEFEWSHHAAEEIETQRCKDAGKNRGL